MQDIFALHTEVLLEMEHLPLTEKISVYVGQPMRAIAQIFLESSGSS